LIGSIFQGYQVLDRIKDGSVGTVWRAQDARGRVVALKQLALKHAAIPAKRKIFAREARITSKLSHPGIIKVYEYVDADPQPFFAMEYFESENLKYSMMRLPERVDGHEFTILGRVARALAHVHSRGIAHRDIKPENVLVSARSEVRLIDFSLALTRVDRWLRLGRRVEGTPQYMSPEQVCGEAGDERSDVYSFGVMAYELLAKTPPLSAGNAQGLLEKHLKETPPPMRTYVPTIAQDLDAFVLRMLSKDPSRRPPHMAVVVAELTRWERKDTVVRRRQAIRRPKSEIMKRPVELASTGL
jgi:serine/threonine-protein kinase